MAKKWYNYSYVSRKEIRHRIFIFFVLVGLLCILSFLIGTFLVWSVKTGSSSMTPELLTGDCLMVTPLRSRDSRQDSGEVGGLTGFIQPLRGDMVYVAPLYPAGMGPVRRFADAVAGFFTFQRVFPFSDSTLMGESSCIRRLIGLPGDTIYMDNFVLYIRPSGSSYFLTEFELAENTYDVLITGLPENWSRELAFSGTMGEVVLGDDEYFLLADNRIGPVDSRLWGSVPASRITGKVFLRYWPPGRFSPL
ncbi:MAG: signal peptidase I [Spirochaetaceae bacterium]|jgi:signal peptidase I|nr:signal peptidase I [Spirochaetaceae bacterium]